MKTYEITISDAQIFDSPEYQEWLRDISRTSLDQIFIDNNPGLLYVHERYGNGLFNWVLEFESEEHYTWFLLRR